MVILAPGFGTTAAVWDAAEKHLNPEMLYLRIDLPGHGLSPAVTEPFTVDDLTDAVIALADEYEIKQFAYAGVSLGGGIGLNLALRYPERVKVVLPICSAPKFGNPEDWAARAASVRENGTAQFVESSRDRWFSKKFQDRKPQVVEQTMQMLRNVDAESYALGCGALGDFDITKRLAEIKVPVMVVCGELDQVVTHEYALAYSQQLGNGSIIEVGGVAHQAALEAPEVIAKHINYSVRQHK